MLATYELGRRMFRASSGLLAGVLLGTAVLFCAAAHFANPDSLLNACSLFALFFFWRDYAAGKLAGWSPWSAAAAGLGVLAKGPVGFGVARGRRRPLSAVAVGPAACGVCAR